MNEERVITNTNLPFKLFSKGKVRDTWEPSSDYLWMVATDRVSAFDVIVGAIPDKGKILTKMSKFWFNLTQDLVWNHFLGIGIPSAYHKNGRSWIDAYDLMERTMIVRKANVVVPVECVVRGYLAGSGWEEYQKTGMVCGNKLPPDLREGDKLPEPIFTPATKAEAGQHDENITYEQMVIFLREWLWKSENVRIRYFASTLASELESISLSIYQKASDYAAERGIILADTKLEFGIKDNKLMLIDELLTPDSSRFWPADQWKPGRSQKSFDKQYLRDWLVSIGWNKKPPAPQLPEEVIRVTAEKYNEAARRLLP